jgi:large subunit ribosomal protein L4e
MKTPVYGLDGKEKGFLELRREAFADVNSELIKRAFWAEMSKKRQPYGVDPLAGKRSSAHYHGRRGIRMSMMNREMARMKRIHNQGILNFTARFVPQARKGRKAHPPRAERVFERKMNKKEREKALTAAISASFREDMVAGRGHILNGIKSLPLILADDIQKASRAKDVKRVLKAVGLEKELERAAVKKIRAGKGKSRGRVYRKRRGPLLIVAEDRGVKKAASNIPGVEVSTVGELTFDLLAPGGNPGRLCVWSESAIRKILI